MFLNYRRRCVGNVTWSLYLWVEEVEEAEEAEEEAEEEEENRLIGREQPFTHSLPPTPNPP